MTEVYQHFPVVLLFTSQQKVSALFEKMHAFCTTEYHLAALLPALWIITTLLLQYPRPSLDGDAAHKMSVADSTGRPVNLYMYTQVCVKLLFECV